MFRPPAGGGAGEGTVTEVTGTLPISVASGTTTPVVSVADAGAAAAGVVTTGAQTFAGDKTFNGVVISGAASGAVGVRLAQGARIAFDGASTRVLYWDGTSYQFVGAITSSSSVTAGGFATTGAYISSVASGSVAFRAESGARVVFDGSTASRYAAWDGSNVAFSAGVSTPGGGFTTSGGLTITASTGLIVGSGATGGIIVRASTTDASGNFGTRIGSTTNLTAAGANAAEIVNNSTAAVVRFPWEGGIRLNVAGTAEPAASETRRGEIIYVRGGAGVAETLKVCMKDPTDESYAWYTIATSS